MFTYEGNFLSCSIILRYIWEWLLGRQVCFDMQERGSLLLTRYTSPSLFSKLNVDNFIPQDKHQSKPTRDLKHGFSFEINQTTP
jgi:hypothetical protein